MGLIKVDQVTGVEIRGPDGLCQRCQPGEPGEWVGQIVKNHPIRDFHGYADQSSTQKKILHNVWKQGDMCFRSGDILTMDEFGWFYFKDRSGDTFRWHGENVSTTEVESIVSNMIDLKDVVVYGVEIPGTYKNTILTNLAKLISGQPLQGLLKLEGGQNKLQASKLTP